MTAAAGTGACVSGAARSTLAGGDEGAGAPARLSHGPVPGSLAEATEDDEAGAGGTGAAAAGSMQRRMGRAPCCILGRRGPILGGCAKRTHRGRTHEQLQAAGRRSAAAAAQAQASSKADSAPRRRKAAKAPAGSGHQQQANQRSAYTYNSCIPEAGECNSCIPEAGECNSCIPEAGECNSCIPEAGECNSCIPEATHGVRQFRYLPATSAWPPQASPRGCPQPDPGSSSCRANGILLWFSAKCAQPFLSQGSYTHSLHKNS